MLLVVRLLDKEAEISSLLWPYLLVHIMCSWYCSIGLVLYLCIGLYGHATTACNQLYGPITSCKSSYGHILALM